MFTAHMMGGTAVGPADHDPGLLLCPEAGFSSDLDWVHLE